MSTELYHQARKLKKMFPDWTFPSIVHKLNRSQFLPNSFETLVQSKIRRKRKRMDKNHDMRKKLCSVQNKSIDILPTCDNVIVINSSDDSTDSETEIIDLNETININTIKENLLSIFPECAPLYIEFLITLAKDSISNENLIIEHIVSRLINENYPKANENNDSTLSVPDIIQSVQELPEVIPQLIDETSPHTTDINETNFLKSPFPDLITVENQNTNNRLTKDLSDGEANNECLSNLKTTTPNVSSVKNEFLNQSNANDLKELFNNVEMDDLFNNDSFDEFMKVYSELEDLSNLPQEDIIDSDSVEIKPNSKNSEPLIIKQKSENMNDSELDTNAENLVLKLLPIFPDACPKYLRKLCKGRQNNATELEEIIMYLIQKDFPKRITMVENSTEQDTVEEEEQYQIMLELLPDADPDYLRVHCSNLYDKPDRLKQFIDDAIEHKNYPTLKDYKRKQQLSAQMKQYTTEFNVNKFLELIPNPKEYFNDPKRACTYNIQTNVDHQKSLAIVAHMKDVFKNIFLNIRMNDINQVIKNKQKRVISIYNELKQGKYEKMKRPRKPAPLQQLYGEINVPYMQEIAYVTHYDEIHNALKQREHEKQMKFEKAKVNGELLQCECCFDDEIMAEDTFTCDDGHRFCKSCIVRSVEIAFGENKLQFMCLTNCKAEFSLVSLQKILKPNMFSKIALRKQIEEVKSAGIEDLESCPFCDFATIPIPGDKVFECLNEECLKESCRNCKELSHIPYRCDEIEKNNEVKARTYIEDKMTEALVRKCWKCGMKFIKEDGCNKMTCQCGAMMCYVCGEPVKGYNHFNGQGGTNYELCPLYSDTEKLHLDAVRKIGEEAKQEIKEKNPSVQLKYDPLTGLPKAKEKDTVYKPGIQYNPFEEHQRIMFLNNIQHQRRINYRNQHNDNYHNQPHFHRNGHQHHFHHHHHHHPPGRHMHNPVPHIDNMFAAFMPRGN